MELPKNVRDMSVTDKQILLAKLEAERGTIDTKLSALFKEHDEIEARVMAETGYEKNSGELLLAVTKDAQYQDALARWCNCREERIDLTEDIILLKDAIGRELQGAKENPYGNPYLKVKEERE